MIFEQFAAAHGLIIDKGVEFGRWVRTGTEDKPRKKNGSYKHLGTVAFVQNFATMAEAAIWYPDNESEIRINKAEIARIQANAARLLEIDRKKAAEKAAYIISKSTVEQHAYLDGHGFPDATGLVYRPDESTNLLVIPMRVGKQAVGCQLISVDGDKRFIRGQQCAGAEFVIGEGKGLDVWLEGYATGLSVCTAVQAIGTRCRIHVCFSSGNLESMAKEAGKGVVIADNDVSGTGERAAKATGLRYFLPPDIGTDFNDLHKRVGTFSASQLIRRLLQQK